MKPILFNFGPVNIYSFGLFLFLGFLVSSFFFWRQNREEIPEEKLFDLIWFVLLGGLLGARLVYIALNFSQFGWQILRFIHLFLYPGLSFWGAILGGCLFGLGYIFKNRLPLVKLADSAVLAFLPGLILGEIGYFLNGGVVGKVTNLPWGINVVGFLEKRHPVLLYEASLNFFLWFFLLRLKDRFKAGALSLSFLAILGFFSFLFGFFKIEKISWLIFSSGQVFFLGLFLFGGLAFYFRQRSLRQDLAKIAFLFLKIFKKGQV